jgi:uncharacterized protein (TIGR02246 family)
MKKLDAARRHDLMTDGLSFAALLVCLATLAMIASPAAAQSSDAPLVVAIMAENAKWAAAYKAGDFTAIGALYTDDGTLLPPGGNRVAGRDAITRYFQNEYAGRQTGTISFSDYEVYGGGRVVTEVANLAIYGRDGKLKSRGKQILIFLKQGDQWKLHRDIWNSDPE